MLCFAVLCCAMCAVCCALLCCSVLCCAGGEGGRSPCSGQSQHQLAVPLCLRCAGVCCVLCAVCCVLCHVLHFCTVLNVVIAKSCAVLASPLGCAVCVVLIGADFCARCMPCAVCCVLCAMRCSLCVCVFPPVCVVQSMMCPPSTDDTAAAADWSLALSLVRPSSLVVLNKVSPTLLLLLLLVGGAEQGEPHPPPPPPPPRWWC